MNDTLSGPDLTKGVALSAIGDGAMLLGHAHGEPALLVRHGGELFAIGAACTHYGAPLADGLLVDETVRCPWHHACFSLRTGEALRPPALDPVSCWHVEQRDGTAYVGTKIESVGPPSLPAQAGMPEVRRDRGWWRSGQRRGRNAPAPGLFRPHHDVERRFVWALRSPQSFQGLPVGRGVRGVQPPPIGGLLSRTRHRA